MSQRILDIGTQNYTKVVCLDEPNPKFGNACHKYKIDCIDDSGSVIHDVAEIHFQEGPIKEIGINGCQNENLITIVIDRLEHFQNGKFKCRENALALTKLEEAMHWLNHRTTNRQKRGVEGASII